MTNTVPEQYTIIEEILLTRWQYPQDLSDTLEAWSRRQVEQAIGRLATLDLVAHGAIQRAYTGNREDIEEIRAHDVDTAIDAGRGLQLLLMLLPTTEYPLYVEFKKESDAESDTQD